MAEPTNRFVLKFHSNVGRVVRLGIPRANPDKTEAEIRDVMEAIAADGVVATANQGYPTVPKRAQLVTTTRRRIV